MALALNNLQRLKPNQTYLKPYQGKRMEILWGSMSKAAGKEARRQLHKNVESIIE